MIHATAIIDPTAEIHPSAQVGPYCVIGADVVVGEDTIIEPHVVIKGPTTIGARNHIFQFSSIGESTPDLKYKGEATTLTIGNDNVIRESVTIHRGTIQDRGDTSIGNSNLIMCYVHIGHDSVVKNHTILVNNTALARSRGCRRLGDPVGFTRWCISFVKIGAHSFSGMGTAIGKDVPAYVTVSGSPAEARTINSEGLRRRGFSDGTLADLRRAFKLVYRQGLTLDVAIERLGENGCGNA